MKGARISLALTISSLFLLLQATFLFALDPTKAITQYVHSTWQSEQGLPANSIYDILQTRDGYLWIATEEGLARFDGARMVVFNKENTPEFKHNWVRTLWEGRDGTLWIGLNVAGLIRYRDGKFSAENGLPNDFIRAIVEDLDGNLWIGTRGGGLLLYKNGKFQAFTEKDGFRGNKIRCLYLDRKGELWIGTDGDGLVRMRNRKFTSISTVDGLPGNSVHSVVEDRHGNYWIGTDGGGLSCMRNGEFKNFTTHNGLSSGLVFSILEDRSGNLWIGTDTGINRMLDQKFETYNTRGGLSNDTVYRLYEDREGSLWIGTWGGGLNRFRDGKFTNFTTREGLVHDVVLAIREDRSGSIWIGTESGLSRLSAGVLKNFTTNDGLADNRVYTIFEDRKGNRWFGTASGLNLLQNGKIKEIFKATVGLSQGEVDHIVEGPDGNIRVAVDDRFYQITANQLDLASGISLNDNITAAYLDRNQNLWIGTVGGGLKRLRDNKLDSFKKEQGFLDDAVWSFYEDRDGTLWIGTRGSGLSRLKDGKFTNYTTRNGLYNDGVFAILEDENENLWISSNKGIYRVSKKELNDFAEGKIVRISSVSYGIADGMKESECVGGTDPAGWKTRDGRLWFGTIGGVAVIDPKNIVENKLAPPVLIEEILIDGKSPDEKKKGKINAIHPGWKNLEFRYTANSFLVPERVLFRYQLEGYDENWINAGTRRTAYYTNLPPRKYRFRVIACNNDGVWNEAGADVSFSVEPHFYQTSWFYIISALFAVQIGISIHRARIRNLRRREKELVEVVNEKTKDLQSANRKLTEAQDRINKLLESQPQALENISVWSKSLAEDIARVIGATSIDVWILEGEQFRSETNQSLEAPSLERVEEIAGTPGAWEQEMIIPVTGTSGPIRGALTISGKNVVWGETERRLILGLAQQLGSALELHSLHQELASAQEIRVQTLREMHERGIATTRLCPLCGRCYDHTVTVCNSDGTDLETPRILPYSILDRYRLVQLLGQGGIGIVFQAYDEKLKRSVAIKIVRKEFLDDPMTRVRWEREAHVVARLRHPGIIALYDVGELPDSSVFLVMELLEGSDLSRILKQQGPASPVQVADVVTQVADALACAHQAGVIHRDLKPANLILLITERSFQTKVLDFGLAKSMHEETTLTRTGMLVGTPSYMSPEQIREQPLDGRSDLFSLAAVAYELLTGSVAFYAELVPEVMVRILLENPDPLSARLKGSGPELEQALLWALEKDPKKRPATVIAWVEKFVPILRKTQSNASGWDLKSVKRHLSRF